MDRSIVITCSGDMERKSCDDVELMAVNEFVSVLRRKDSSPWRLEKGDTMVLYHTDQLLRHMRSLYETLWVGYIKNDVLCGVKKLNGHDSLYHFTAPEKGIYCLCFIASEMIGYL